jgi:hypothetical protein
MRESKRVGPVLLDHAGIRQYLSSNEVAQPIHAAAEQIARNVQADWPGGADVVVKDYTTDRAASSITIREPNAMLLQARDGVLTRAAGRAGHEVKQKR